MNNDELELVARTAEGLLAGVRDRGDTDTAAESASGWQLLADHGMTRVSVPDPLGAGESPKILGTLLKTLGRSAFSLPLIDTHVGLVLTEAAGLTDVSNDPDSADACAIAIDPRVLCPSAPKPSRLAVTHPGLADIIVSATAETDLESVRIDTWRWSDLGLDSGRNAAGEPVALFDVDALPSPLNSARLPMDTVRRVALLDSVGRSLMIAGAAERALEQTLIYVSEREQFGRKLAAFQSVQHTVAQMASLVTAASISADAALDVIVDFPEEASSPVSDREAVAVLSSRVQCLRTAAFVARAAHQLHGAIGFTQEHSLRFATTRLTAWRAHGPTQSEVAKEIGRRAYSDGDLWAFVTGVRT